MQHPASWVTSRLLTTLWPTLALCFALRSAFPQHKLLLPSHKLVFPSHKLLFPSHKVLSPSPKNAFSFTENALTTQNAYVCTHTAFACTRSAVPFAPSCKSDMSTSLQHLQVKLGAAICKGTGLNLCTFRACFDWQLASDFVWALCKKSHGGMLKQCCQLDP